MIRDVTTMDDSH